jgi:hypothetical protein
MPSVHTCCPALLCPYPQVVGNRALLMLDQFKEQELSNVVWAFAKLHHYDGAMFQKLLEAVSNKLHHFLPQVRAQAVHSAGSAHAAEGALRTALQRCWSYSRGETAGRGSSSPLRCLIGASSQPCSLS